MATPYPNTFRIEEIFATRDNPSIFNTYLADSIDVSVVGVDFNVAGRHTTPQAFHDQIWGRLSAVTKIETLRIDVARVIGGGESSWAAVESSCTATSKTGKLSDLERCEGGIFFLFDWCWHAMFTRYFLL